MSDWITHTFPAELHVRDLSDGSRLHVYFDRRRAQWKWVHSMSGDTRSSGWAADAAAARDAADRHAAERKEAGS